VTKPLAIGIRLPPCEPADVVAEAALRAESLGFDQIYVPDSQVLWRDSYLTLFACALKTSTITLSTAVTNVVTRHPSVIASLTRTIAEVSNGRFQLGLGVGNSSVEPVGLRPSTQADMRDGIATIRALLNGEAVDFDGVSTWMRDPFPGVPIHMAASGPRNLKLAGEIADGAILLSGISPETLSRSAALVRAGALEGGRDASTVMLTVSTYCHVTNDVERDARMLKPICAGIAQNGGRAALELAGINIDVPPRVPGVYPDLVHAEDWGLAVEKCSEWVSDDDAVAFANAFCLFGDAEHIARGLRTAQSAGATSVFLQHVGSYTLPYPLMEEFSHQVMPLLEIAT